MPLPFYDWDLEPPPPAMPTLGGTITTAPGLIAQSLVGQEFDTAKRLELPGWMLLLAPGEGRTARSGPNQATTYGAHEPRFYSEDGTTWGVLLEPSGVNVIEEDDFSTWADGGTPVLSTATTPIGTIENVHLLDDDAGVIETKFLTLAGLATGVWTVSAWGQVIAPTPTTGAGLPRVLGNTPNFEIVTGAAVDTDWTYRSTTATVVVTGGSTAVHFVPRRTTAADTGAARMWGVQLEARSYPTSWHGGSVSAGDVLPFTREADTLRALGTTLAPEGFFSLRLKYRPHYTHAEPTVDHNLVYFDDDNRLFYDESATTFVLRVGGVNLTSAAVTFSRHQELTLTIEHSTVRRGITLEGATTGNGLVTGAASDAMSFVPTYAIVLGGPDGSEEGADLQALVPGLTTFCALADERVLVQIEDEGERVFRELVCALVQQPGRFFDVCLAARAAFDLDTAVGVQLDMLGSWIGLAREGFTDDRYRTFLGIQSQLLLSAQRIESAWTGTGENILAITRRFIGPGIDPILLINEPPYSYELSVPGLVLSEAFLLARFLTIANYAAVLGLLLIPLGIGGIMGSASVAVPSAGIMGSASVAVAGAMIMGTVVTT